MSHASIATATMTCRLRQVTTAHSSLLQVCKRTGAVVEVIPEEPDGEISVCALEALITNGRQPALVAITHIPTNSGWGPHVSI